LDGQRLPLDETDLRYDVQWLDGARAQELFDTLHASIAWERHRIRLFGREVGAPRLSCWIGDAGAVYTYSRVRYEPRPWTGPLSALRQRLHETCGVDFNGVLANLYRDGSDCMGWHADDEPELDPAAPVASLSLGAARRFALRPLRDRHRRSSIELAPGSLLLMSAAMQKQWQHALPRTARLVGARINLTFRRIVPGAFPSQRTSAPRCVPLSAPRAAGPHRPRAPAGR
jgi:alkylated DNA repair dioxygenase AlkB